MPPTVANGITLSPHVLDMWIVENASVEPLQDGYVFESAIAAGEYDKVAHVVLAPEASYGGYVRVNAASAAGGYAYIGLTQSILADTFTFAQNDSKIDFGLKLDGGAVHVVLNGTEVGVIGDNQPIYTVIFDGTSGIVILKGDVPVFMKTLSELSTLGISINSSQPLTLGIVAYTPQLTIPFTAGSIAPTNLTIGQGGKLDPISSQSSYTLDTVSGQLTLRVKLADNEPKPPLYEIRQLGPFPVLQTVETSNVTPVDGILTFTIQTSGFIGADIQVTRVDFIGNRNLPFTITDKILTHGDIETAGVYRLDGYGFPYPEIALLLTTAYNAPQVTHIALIDPNLYSPDIQSLGTLDESGQVTIVEVTDLLAIFSMLPNSTRLVVPGTVSTPGTLTINPNVPKFSIYIGSIGTIFGIPRINTLRASPFQQGTDAVVDVKFLGTTTTTTFALFTQDSGRSFYRMDRLSLIYGYVSSLTSSNGVLTLTAPQAGIYYIYPTQINTDDSIVFLGGVQSIVLQGTQFPPNAAPYSPSITHIDTDSIPGSLIVEWFQPPGDNKAPDAVSFSITFKDANGDIVKTVSQISTPFTESGLSAGDYTFILTAVSASGSTASTLDQQFTITGGGGGGGGGGGNTGGNGHNNMGSTGTASLEFSYTGYSGEVKQVNTITVLGEEGGALPPAFTTITVHVTPEELSNTLAYKSAWGVTGEAEGEQPLPDVQFLPVTACGPRLRQMYDLLSTKGSGPQDSDGRKFLDSAADTQERFGNLLMKVSFANSWLDDDQLPREAIRQIQEGDLNLPTGGFATSDAGSVVSDLSTSVTGTAASTVALLHGLFEQAVAADKIKGVVASGANMGSPDYPALGAGWKKAQFIADDSISFLVRMSFQKTRDYQLDGQLTGNDSGNSVPVDATTGAPAKSIRVNGIDYEIVAQDEESALDEKLFIIKLLAKDVPVDAAAKA